MRNLHLAVRIGAVAVTLISAVALFTTPASASGSQCRTSSAVPSDQVCLFVNGSGAHVASTDNLYYRAPGAKICDYRAWNSGADSANSAWSKSSSIYYQCLYTQATVTMSINRTVYDPSFYYGQFYANGAWIPAYPRVLITS